MSPIYTFTCAAGHSTDALGAVGVTPFRPCSECALPAERQSVYANAQIGVARTPNDQKMVDLKEFKEAGAELEYAEEKVKASGDPVPKTPSLWKEAQRQAKDLQSRGVQDSSDFRGTADGEVKHRTRWLGPGLTDG